MKLPKIIKKLLSKIFADVCDEDLFIHYLCVGEALPIPLSQESEHQYIRELSNASQTIKENAKAKLIEHNLRLVVYISKKFENSGIDIEDLISVGSIGLIKAVNNFNSEKNIKLATFASKCIENEILMHLRKSVKLKREISLDEPLSSDGDGNELILSDILSCEKDCMVQSLELSVEKKILSELLVGLTKKEQIIISLRFGLDGSDEKTQKEVADFLGISQSYISRIEKKILGKLKKEIIKKI